MTATSHATPRYARVTLGEALRHILLRISIHRALAERKRLRLAGWYRRRRV